MLSLLAFVKDSRKDSTLVNSMTEVQLILFMAYVLCMNCGRTSLEGMFCTYCHSPLILGSFSNPLTKIEDGVYLGDMEGENSPFLLPINPYFGFHFAFYGVTGTGKTRAAMNLAINSENKGLCLRIIDVEGEWKKIIPMLKKETVFYDSEFNLKVNPFDLNDQGLTLAILKETIFIILLCLAFGLTIFSSTHLRTLNLESLILTLTIIIASIVITAIIYLQRKQIGYKWFVKGKEARI